MTQQSNSSLENYRTKEQTEKYRSEKEDFGGGRQFKAKEKENVSVMEMNK